MSKHQLLINGELVNSSTGKVIDDISPATGEVIAQVPETYPRRHESGRGPQRVKPLTMAAGRASPMQGRAADSGETGLLSGCARWRS